MAEDTTDPRQRTVEPRSIPSLYSRLGLKHTLGVIEAAETYLSSSYRTMPALEIWPEEEKLRRDVAVFVDRSRTSQAGMLFVTVIPGSCEIEFQVWPGGQLAMLQLHWTLTNGLSIHKALIEKGATARDRGPGEQRKPPVKSPPAVVDALPEASDQVKSDSSPPAETDASPEDRLTQYEERLRADIGNANGVARRRLALIAVWRKNPSAVAKAGYEILAAMLSKQDELVACSYWNVRDDLKAIEGETGISMRGLFKPATRE